MCREIRVTQGRARPERHVTDELKMGNGQSHLTAQHLNVMDPTCCVVTCVREPYPACSLGSMTEQPLDKLAYSIPSLAAAVDLSVDTIRKAIDNNDLIVSYPTRAGRKPIITRKNAEQWLDNLPVESPRDRRESTLPTGSEPRRTRFGQQSF
jgi:hypothetical protein